MIGDYLLGRLPVFGSDLELTGYELRSPMFDSTDATENDAVIGFYATFNNRGLDRFVGTSTGIINLTPEAVRDELWKEILFEGESYDREDAKRVCMSFLASIFPWSFSMPPQAAVSDVNADCFSIRQAGEKDLDAAAGLFDLYRQFYEEKPDLKLAKCFLKERMKTGSSVIYLALDGNGRAVGFMQLYPLFCSVAATPIWVLYDLYVDASVRRHGIGKQLMNQARELAKSTGASRIDLETAVDNINAQALYETLGYERDTEFFKYSLYIETD